MTKETLLKTSCASVPTQFWIALAFLMERHWLVGVALSYRWLGAHNPTVKQSNNPTIAVSENRNIKKSENFTRMALAGRAQHLTA